MTKRRFGSRVALLAAIAVALTACSSSSPAGLHSPSPGRAATRGAPSLEGIHKIQQVIVIMQENRSFDSYFGTYPGVDGLKMSGGRPTNCIPDPRTGGPACAFHDAHHATGGGPHAQHNFTADPTPAAPNASRPQ